MKYTIWGILIIAGGILVSSFSNKKKNDPFKDNEKVLDILVSLGDKRPLHYIAPKNRSSEIVSHGKNIAFNGFTTKDGEETKIQSKHFVCTDCHNMVQEDPDLAVADPEARLKYAAKMNIPLLPATTMAGVVNRETWYNDDYSKKYGSLVAPARDTLRNAIHLCAVQCSQGRALEDWEMEAMVQYFLSIGHDMNDLALNEDEKEKVRLALNGLGDEKAVIDLIKSKYILKSPATFMYPQKKENRKLGENGNPENGKKIFELSCLTCHKETGVTNYKLNSTTLTFNHLKYWSSKDAHFSVYNIIRKGTYAKNGYKPYMPNYTKERLSDQQLEDLVAYINSMAN